MASTAVIDLDEQELFERMTTQELEREHRALLNEYAALVSDVDFQHNPPLELVIERDRMEARNLNICLALSSRWRRRGA